MPGFVEDYVRTEERQQEARQELWERIHYRVGQSYAVQDSELDAETAYVAKGRDTDAELKRWERLYPDKTWEQRLEVYNREYTRGYNDKLDYLNTRLQADIGMAEATGGDLSPDFQRTLINAICHNANAELSTLRHEHPEYIRGQQDAIGDWAAKQLQIPNRHELVHDLEHYLETVPQHCAEHHIAQQLRDQIHAAHTQIYLTQRCATHDLAKAQQRHSEAIKNLTPFLENARKFGLTVREGNAIATQHEHKHVISESYGISL
jgi:hypothetical protein